MTPASTSRIRLAVTLGDPRGIGPEVAAAAASVLRADADFLFIGPAGTGAEAAADAFVSVGEWSGGGTPAEAGAVAGRAIEEGTRRVLAGEAAALVTAPIDKAALHAAGWADAGHTELLARLTGAPDAVMLMAAETERGPLRVVLATTHLALRDVPAIFDADLLVRQTRVTRDALRTYWDIDQPRIALCAFNPHASDGGRFGDEEATIYGPAIGRLHADGIPVAGPIPADTVFVRALRGEFDAVIAPYHDVGMAAFKTAAFGRGVNVTLGLPILRTSPDHGTATDIAGRGMADSSSMQEAMRLALRLALRRPAVRGA